MAIPKTPFHVVGNDEQGYFVGWGQYRITEMQKTPEDCIQLINEQGWDLLGVWMGSIAEATVRHIMKNYKPTEEIWPSYELKEQ